MTKTVVSIAALRLIDQKLLELEAPVKTWLPELEQPQVLVGFEGNEPVYKDAQTPITVRHLLTHTAGFGYEFLNALLYKFVETGQGASVLAGDPGFIHAPLIAEPGTAFNYGISSDWLGILVERVGKAKLGEYLESEIFSPLGMKDTAFHVKSDQKHRLVEGYMPTPDGWIKVPMADGSVPAFESGGGGLYSTANDYFRFCQMLLNGGSLDGYQVISEEICAELSNDHLSPISFPVFEATTPVFPDDIEYFPGHKKYWGLGGLVLPDGLPQRRSPASHCWSGIFNTYYWVDRRAGKTGVVLMQVTPYYHESCLAVFDAVETYAYSG